VRERAQSGGRPSTFVDDIELEVRVGERESERERERDRAMRSWLGTRIV
jgi:hypothetical protein